MLRRKIEKIINDYFDSNSNKILVIDGARQVGKSYIIRYLGQKRFKNYIEINFADDYISGRNFENIGNIKDFYFKLSVIAGDKMKSKEDTLIFIDEIQTYPQFLTLLKFLKQDDRYTYICSGSLLGVTLYKTSSIPMGSISIEHMYPLDLEEFLYANNFNDQAINELKNKFINKESLDDNMHNLLLSLFKKYLLIGGMPDVVNTFIQTDNIVEVRKIQKDIIEFYGDDASKYDLENKLKIKRIYDLVPSTLSNKNKRIIVKDIENKKGKRYSNYQDEFDYLISSGIFVDVKAISNPVFPLVQSSDKNLLKLYLNDVGLLSSIYYGNNINAVLNDELSINLGALYENAVATELKAHGYKLYYYDNKKNGEVDYLIDDYNDLSILPLEIKSGKDYKIHSAITKFIENKDYNVKKGIVFSNHKEIYEENNILYLPIYYIMFIKNL